MEFSNENFKCHLSVYKFLAFHAFEMLRGFFCLFEIAFFFLRIFSTKLEKKKLRMEKKISASWNADMFLSFCCKCNIKLIWKIFKTLRRYPSTTVGEKNIYLFLLFPIDWNLISINLRNYPRIYTLMPKRSGIFN